MNEVSSIPPSGNVNRALKTQDLHILGTIPVPSPAALKREISAPAVALDTVMHSRDAIKHILLGQDPRLLVIVGPCSIHDEKAAVEYAGRLNELRHRYAQTMLIVMRVYFEKPRTTTGWKGLIYDPNLNGSFDITKGLHIARNLLLEVTSMGLATATEFLDPIVPQYTADLVSWAAIGARTTESQTHRQMASGLSMPVGYKNSTDGNLQVAINAMISAQAPHNFLGIDQEGKPCIVQTAGNRWGHVILRGGSGQPNYDPENVKAAVAQLQAAKLPAQLMVDCSHANSSKQHERQEIVFNSVIAQRAAGNKQLIGLMLESNLIAGCQDLPADLDHLDRLQYGQSITDACIDWTKTEELLDAAHDALN